MIKITENINYFFKHFLLFTLNFTTMKKSNHYIEFMELKNLLDFITEDVRFNMKLMLKYHKDDETMMIMYEHFLNDLKRWYRLYKKIKKCPF